MTRDEMQRFLDLAAIRGLGELEAYRNLVQVIGISYHSREEEEPRSVAPETGKKS